MSWNGFGPEGGAALADAIATNESLVELDISGNRLDIQSAFLIAKVINDNEQLQILKVVLTYYFHIKEYADFVLNNYTPREIIQFSLL